jgi:hypothetical protein
MPAYALSTLINPFLIQSPGLALSLPMITHHGILTIDRLITAVTHLHILELTASEAPTSPLVPLCPFALPAELPGRLRYDNHSCDVSRPVQLPKAPTPELCITSDYLFRLIYLMDAYDARGPVKICGESERLVAAEELRAERDRRARLLHMSRTAGIELSIERIKEMGWEWDKVQLSRREKMSRSHMSVDIKLGVTQSTIRSLTGGSGPANKGKGGTEVIAGDEYTRPISSATTKLGLKSSIANTQSHTVAHEGQTTHETIDSAPVTNESGASGSTTKEPAMPCTPSSTAHTTPSCDTDGTFPHDNSVESTASYGSNSTPGRAQCHSECATEDDKSSRSETPELAFSSMSSSPDSHRDPSPQTPQCGEEEEEISGPWRRRWIDRSWMGDWQVDREEIVVGLGLDFETGKWSCPC